METEKRNFSFLIKSIFLIAACATALTFVWMFAQAVAKNEVYDTIGKSLDDCKIENSKLLAVVDSLKNTPQQIIITKGESKSILNGQVIVTPDYYLSTSVRLKFTGTDGVSKHRDSDYSEQSIDIEARVGDRLYVKKNNSIWGINVLKISPTTIEVVKIE